MKTLNPTRNLAPLMMFLALAGNVAMALPPQLNGNGGNSNGPNQTAQQGQGEQYRIGINNQLVQYKIGIFGYDSPSGVVVNRTTRIFDINRGRSRCAAEEIQVDFLGNGRLVAVRLERGDLITSIEGQPVRSLSDLAVLMNAASDPTWIQIGVEDGRTGQRLVGHFNAVKVQ